MRVQVDVVKVKESLLIPKLLILIRINTLYLIVNINTILRVIARGLQRHQYCIGEGGEGVGGDEGARPQEGVEERQHEGEVGPHLGAQDRRGQQDRAWSQQGGEVFFLNIFTTICSGGNVQPSCQGRHFARQHSHSHQRLEGGGHGAGGQVQDPSISSDMLVRLILLCPSCWRPASRSNLRGSHLRIHWIQERGNPCTLCDISLTHTNITISKL